MAEKDEITGLLVAWNEGDTSSLEKLIPIVEVELRRMAHSYMNRESAGHTLQTTALINEAYLKLIGPNKPEWQNRAQFFGVAANVMRRILINHARDNVTQKRGGPDANRVPLHEEALLSNERSAELIALDEALNALAKFDPTKSRIVELKTFGGLTADEIAGLLGVATSTVNLHWRLAKAWLANEIKGSRSIF